MATARGTRTPPVVLPAADGAHATGPPPSTGAPVGRPRASGRPLEGSARDEIIAVATGLFAEQGFARTTMAQIAEAAGLRQSSLYYYFRRKEHILQATFSVNRAPLDFLKRISSEPGSAALRLFRVIRFDAIQLCEAPCDINEVWRISLVQPELFADFWADRRDLHRRVERLVRDGVADGTFVATDARLAALGILSANEGSQNWWRLRDQHRLDGRAPERPPRYDPVELGDHMAVTALRALLKRPAQVTSLQRDATRLDEPGPAG